MMIESHFEPTMDNLNEAFDGPPIPWRLLDATNGLPSPAQKEKGVDLDETASTNDYDSAKWKSEESEGADDDLMEGYPSEKTPEDECHTLMIKHLPCRCSQKEVLEGIASVGFGDRYEFFYLPIRRGHTQNFGYAFVGFKDQESCSAFSEAMTGYRFPGRSSGKACVLAPARIQGFKDNMEHFDKTRGLRRNNGPILSMSV
jgi:phenylpropionate dioxygenase-like ring-hydroxylating dioxygenase large terminal subunit